MTHRLRVAVSGRTIHRHVGGNTTYARRVYGELSRLGVLAGVLGPAEDRRWRSARYAAYEAMVMQTRAKAKALDLVHYPADTGPVMRKPGLPTVVTIHGVAALHETGIRTSGANRVWLARTRRAAAVADAVITVSKHSRDDIFALTEGAARNIEVIPHGIDLETFRPAASAEIDVALRRHAIHRPFVLYLGNIEPRKNLAEAVAAVDQLNRQGHDLEFLVGGKLAWNYEESVAAIEASPNARRLGWIDESDLRCLMSGAEAFLFPSRYEGFGLPVLEALACGARVACTRRGSLPEVGGDCVSYADDTTANALAQAVAEALSQPRAEASQRGVAHARRFTWEASAQAHLQLFGCLTGPTRT